jgi:hypothetical protein
LTGFWGMRYLDPIERALAKNPLSTQVLERCAQDLLSMAYRGLTAVLGGSDWGRDADIASGDGVPARANHFVADTGRSEEEYARGGSRASRSTRSVPEARAGQSGCLVAERPGERAESASRSGQYLTSARSSTGHFFASSPAVRRILAQGTARTRVIPDNAVASGP